MTSRQNREPLPPEEPDFRIEAHRSFGASIFPADSQFRTAYRPPREAPFRSVSVVKASNQKELATLERHYKRAVKDEKNRVPLLTKIHLGIATLAFAGLGVEAHTSPPAWVRFSTLPVMCVSGSLASTFRAIKDSAPNRASAAVHQGSIVVNPAYNRYHGSVDATPLAPAWVVDNLNRDQYDTLISGISMNGNEAQRAHLVELALNSTDNPLFTEEPSA